jgi:hypothetical protein
MPALFPRLRRDSLILHTDEYGKGLRHFRIGDIYQADIAVNFPGI